MFELTDRRTGKKRKIYGIHKSGPLDDQTKFLIFSGAWHWVWASNFAPEAQAALFQIPTSAVDLLVGVDAPARVNVA
jgi:hypothetical protein